MRTFDSRHYEVLGFQTVSIGGRDTQGWLLRTIADGRPKFTPQVILVPEGKFVDHGRVYFMHSDGRVEDRTRSEVQLPERIAR